MPEAGSDHSLKYFVIRSPGTDAVWLCDMLWMPAAVSARSLRYFVIRSLSTAAVRLRDILQKQKRLRDYLLLDFAREKTNSRPPVLAVRTLIQPP